MHILIAEDDRSFAERLQKILKKDGHTSDHVLNGTLALAALEKQPYDGVISDIQMPGGNGVELLQATWRTFDTPPPFYVHSSEDTFYWADTRWDLPEVIGSAFKDFAIFRSKLIPNMRTELTKWLDTL